MRSCFPRGKVKGVTRSGQRSSSGRQPPIPPQFQHETLYSPALFLRACVLQPYDYQWSGTETQVKAAAVKSIGSFGTSYVPRRLHLNTIWFHNYDPLRVTTPSSGTATWSASAIASP